MPLVLASLVALLTILPVSTDSHEVRENAVEVCSRESTREVGHEARALARSADVSHANPYDNRTPVAILLSPREDAEETRETEEENPEDQNHGHPFAAAGFSPTPWNGLPCHAHTSPDPSHQLARRALFLLHGRLTC